MPERAGSMCARVQRIGVSHRVFMTGNRSDATGTPLSDLLDRLQDLERHAYEQVTEPASEVGSVETYSQQSAWEGWTDRSWSGWSWQGASSSSSQWQQQGQWWERRPAGRSYSPAEVQAWHEQQATAKAAAKAEARAAKRARQKQDQSASGIDPAHFKMGKAHLAVMRVAQKLWTICPRDVNTKDPVLQFSWGMHVPDDLQHNFAVEVVTGHRWGLYVQKQP